ncbi:MAG: serine hydrolase domain-containing protein [Desulfobacteraceae bacterium]|jgi:CubicO group peptidase (beta-lactamase class C family)
MPKTEAIEDPRMSDVDAMTRNAIANGVFPGAVLLVGHNGRVRHHRAFGCADLFSGERVTCDTFFDLASLTKPLATALAVMHLVQLGAVKLDRPVAEIVPGIMGDNHQAITVRHLLSHCSGLPPMRPYYFRLCHLPYADRLNALKRWVRREPLLYQPGVQEEYSDLGFMMLQWLVEALSGLPLDRFVTQNIYRHLVGDVPFFVDRRSPAKKSGRFAATELCPWRGRLLKGRVHDDNAYAMGGIGGHAGLFSTAAAVFHVVQALLDVDAGSHRHSPFEKDCIQTFLKRQSLGRFALGFDTPSSEGSSAGRFFSRYSVGHLGYSGTSFWMDRQKAVIVVLLTNRVHPTRFNPGIKAFRPQLHDAVMAALGM